MTETNSSNGKLVVKSISQGVDKQKIHDYLKKLLKKTSDEKIEKLMNNLPFVLGKNVARKTAEKIIINLKKAGVNAVFIPESSQKAAKNKTKPSASSKVETKPVSRKDIQKEIIGLFNFSVPEIRTSFFYKAGLFLVGFTMILLPLIYISFIGAAFYSLYLHITLNISIFAAVEKG